MANDGWASDYLRQLNTQGPGNPGNIVSSKVQYVSPVVQTEARTNDTPMYTEDDARGAYVAPASGYRAPAGGGWDVNSSDTNLRFSNESGGKQYHVSRTQAAKKSVKKQAQPANGVKTRSAPLSGSDVTAAVVKAVKADGNTSFANWRQSLVNQGWDGDPSKIKYDPSTGKFVDIGGGQAQTGKKQAQSEYRTGGARTPEENKIARSAAGHRTGADLGQLSSQALDAAARFLPALKLLGFGAGAGSADTASTDPESSSIEGQFKNMPWYEDAKAHHEAVKKNMDNYGSALGTLKSTWDDIPWWTKLVMLPPVFKAGSPAAGASTTGNVWAEGGRAAAGDATAGAKAFEESLSRMNGGAVRGAPVEGTARRSFSPAEAAAEGRRLYGPVAERLLAPKGPLTGGARTTLTSADEGLPVGYSILRNPKIDTSSLAGQTSSLVEQLRAAGIPEDQIAASIARINAGAAGREAAAAGREAAAAGGQAAGREAAAASEAAAGREAATSSGQAAGREAAAAGGQAAGREAAAGEAAADGGVSELANAGNAGRSSADEAMRVAENLDELVRSIESGTVDEMGKAWIEALADQKAAGYESEAINDILATARAAGIIK